MKTIHDAIPLVRRELVNTLSFPDHDVLADPISISDRMTVLHQATSLGNLTHQKVDILFEDNEGLKKVVTSIWAIASQKVFLKDQQYIPVHRIHSVDISY